MKNCFSPPAALFRQLAHLVALLVPVVFFDSGLAAADRYAGYSAPALLRSSVLAEAGTARSAAMGQAQTGRPDELSALFLNPAGLSLMGYGEFALSYADRSHDVKSTSLMLALPLGSTTLGLYGRKDYAYNSQYVINGINTLPDAGAYTALGGLSFGFGMLNRTVHAGLGLKYIRSADGSQNPQTAWLGDLGVITYIDPARFPALSFLPRISTGLALRNLPFYFEKNSPELSSPLISAGISLYFRYSLMFNLDVLARNGGASSLRAGLELWPLRFLALRAGLAYSRGTNLAYSWGAGLGTPLGNSRISLEYAGQLDASRNVYHQIAFHQSFQNVFNYQDVAGQKQRVIRASTDRYSSRLETSALIREEDIIERSMAATSRDDSDLSFAAGSKESLSVALFSASSIFLSGRPESTGIEAAFEQAVADSLQRSGFVTVIGGDKLRALPAYDGKQKISVYLNGVTRRLGVEFLLFPAVFYERQYGELQTRLVLFRAGDDRFTARLERVGMETSQALLLEEISLDAVNTLSAYLEKK